MKITHLRRLTSITAPVSDERRCSAHLFFFAVRPHHSAPPSAPLAEGFGADYFQVCRPCIQMSSRIYTVVPRRWTVSSGGLPGSSATPFCLVPMIVGRTRLSTVGDRAFPVAAARGGAEIASRPTGKCKYGKVKYKVAKCVRVENTRTEKSSMA